MLRFIELNESKTPLHPFKTEEDKRKYSKEDCSTFSSAALLIPKDVVVLDFDEDNIIRDKDNNIVSNKEEFLIKYLIENYNPYWTKSQKNHYHLYFKKPNDSKFKIYNWADYFTCGGFQVDYRCENNGLAIVKANDVLRESKEVLTEEVLSNLPELPIICYPLHLNRDLKTCFIDLKEHDGRNTSLFNHIKEVFNKYQFNSHQLLEIGNFINNYMFKEPLSDKEIESFSQRAKDYKINKSVINDESYNADIDLICFDEVKSKPVDWLWFPYLPLNRLTLVVGNPGVGKSYLTIDWASRVSKGEPFPFCEEDKDSISPSTVIFQNGEDGIEDTIKERLSACGANQKNIFIINEIDNPIFNLSDLDRFEKALKEQKPKLIIIDPLQRYLGNISMNSANEVRQLLAPISNLAMKYNCCIILVMHQNKSDKEDIYRALGSIDFVGIARSMLTITNSGTTKVISHTKSSLGKKGENITFDINDEGVVYLDKVKLSNNDILDELQPREEAKEFIMNILKEHNGMYGSFEISEASKEKNISSSTLNRAKDELNVKSKIIQGKWYWVLEYLAEDCQTYNEKDDNVTT